MLFEKIVKKVRYSGDFPNYDSTEDFNVVPVGARMDEAAQELLGMQLEQFCDEELMGGVSVQSYCTDGQNDICFFGSTDGLVERIIEDEYIEYRKTLPSSMSNIDCFASYFLNHRVNSSNIMCLTGQWHVVSD